MDWIDQYFNIIKTKHFDHDNDHVQGAECTSF